MNPVLDAALLPSLGEAGRFAAPAVDVRAERILRIQGYSDPQRVRPRIRKAAEFAAELAAEIAEGAVGFKHLAITEIGDGELVLADAYRFQCKAFERYLAGCRSVVAFVLTAGGAFDAQIDELMRGDRPVEGLFLDSAGWMAVESVTRQFADALKRELPARGLRLTRRMGPGYSYRIGTHMEPWDLDQQRTLFDALDGAALPSELMESAAMHPKMSRSGLYGLRDVDPDPS